ncbi:hypothetical protein LIA77_08429 [Sarocladium implicatum]|nr:hypothetical protein LIA77_08429 [Sarocladium implicatum]
MKYSLVLVAAAGFGQVSATFGFGGKKFFGAKPYTCPQNNDNKCIPDHKGGLSFGNIGLDLDAGIGLKFGGGLWYDGDWAVGSEPVARDIMGRTFGGGKHFSTECGVDKIPAIKCGLGGHESPESFSMTKFDLDFEVEGDLQLEFELLGGRTCRTTPTFCKKGRNTIENKQCGGAKSVKFHYKPKTGKKCKVDFHHIDFDCDKHDKCKPGKPGCPPKEECNPEETPCTPGSPGCDEECKPGKPGCPPTENPPTETPPTENPPTETPPTETPTPQEPCTPGSEGCPDEETPEPCTPGSEGCPDDGNEVTPPPADDDSSTPTPSNPIATSPPSDDDDETPGGPEETPVTPPKGGDDDEDKPENPPKGGDDDEDKPEQPPKGGDDDEDKPEQPPKGGDDDEDESPEEPVDGPDCPEVVPGCLNTWLPIIGECKNSLDKECYCKHSELINEVYDCIYANAGSDDIIAEAIQALQGICAPEIPKNPAIITGGESITSYITVTGTPIITSAIYTTIVVDTTVTVPCVQDGTTIEGSSTVTVIKTEVPVPEVTMPAPPKETGSQEKPETPGEETPETPEAPESPESPESPETPEQPDVDVPPPVVTPPPAAPQPTPPAEDAPPATAGAANVRAGLGLGFAVMAVMAAL